MKTTKKAIATLLILAIFAGLLPMHISAADNVVRVNVGGNVVSGPGWSRSGNVYSISGDVILYGSTRNYRVVISGNVKVTLEDLVITNSPGPPITLNGGSRVVLTLDGVSTLSSGDANSPGILTTGATLTIEAGEPNYYGAGPRLEVSGGDNAAGIGGAGYGDSTPGSYPGGNGGTVIINGGTITAYSRFGAGIGGGKGSGGTNGVNQPRNTAARKALKGGDGGNGGAGGSGGTVTINGGTIRAESTYGAGIGGGRGGRGGAGGRGEPTSYVYKTGDGGNGGNGGSGGNGAGVIINGGTVDARSSYGAAIGGGYGGDGGVRGEPGEKLTNSPFYGVGSPGNPGARGATGSVGSCTVNLAQIHTWRTNTSGPFTYPNVNMPYHNYHSNNNRTVWIQVTPGLAWDDIKGGNDAQDNVRLPLDLIPRTERGATVSWNSNSTQVISLDGTVKRPEYPNDDAIVTLTARVTYGGNYVDIVFILTVPTVTWEDHADTSWYTAEHELARKTYHIENAAQLAGLAKIVNGKEEGLNDDFKNKKIILTSDIDISAYPWEPIGALANPFKGEFDGNGHIVSGMKFVNSANGYKGLFGWNYGYIVNTGVADLLINGSRASGGIAAVNGGQAVDAEGVIENCFVSGSIGASTSGGLAGSNDYGTIMNGYFCGDISGIGSGGLAGTNINGSIESAFYFKEHVDSEELAVYVGPGSAVGATGKGALTCVGWFAGTDGVLVFDEGAGRSLYGSTLLESLNTCAELRSLGFDWMDDPEGGYPIFSPAVREDRVAAATASHTIIVKDYDGKFVENAEIRVGGSVYFTDRLGAIKIQDEMLFAVNRVFVTPESAANKTYRKGESYYALIPGRSHTVFLEAFKDDGKPYITLAADTITLAEVRRSNLSFTRYQGDMLNLLCSGEWNGATGRFMLFQSGGKYIYSDSNDFITLAPGLAGFQPGEPLWLRMLPDDGSSPSDAVPVYIRILRGDSDFEQSTNSVNRQPNFTVSTEEAGFPDSEATKVYPEILKLPANMLATLSSSAQALDGTITFYGYIGDFKKGPKFGFAVGGLDDAVSILRDAKDALKKDYKGPYEKMKSEWKRIVNEKEKLVMKANEWIDFLIDIDVFIDAKLEQIVSTTLDKYGVTGLYDTLYEYLDKYQLEKLLEKLDWVSEQVNAMILDALEKSGVQAAAIGIIKKGIDALGIVDVFDDLFNQLDVEHIQPLFIALGANLDFLTAELRSALDRFQAMYKEPYYKLKAEWKKVVIAKEQSVMKATEWISFFESFDVRMDAAMQKLITDTLNEHGVTALYKALMNELTPEQQEKLKKKIEEVNAAVKGAIIDAMKAAEIPQTSIAILEAYIDALGIVDVFDDLFEQLDIKYIQPLFKKIDDSIDFAFEAIMGILTEFKKEFAVFKKAYDMLKSEWAKVVTLKEKAVMKANDWIKFLEGIGAYIDIDLRNILMNALNKYGLDEFYKKLSEYVSPEKLEQVKEKISEVRKMVTDAIVEALYSTGAPQAVMDVIQKGIDALGIVDVFDELFDKIDAQYLQAFFKKVDDALDFAFDTFINFIKVDKLVAAEKEWKAFKSDFQAVKKNLGTDGCLRVMKEKYGIAEKEFSVASGVVTGAVGGIGYFEIKFDIYGRQLTSTGEVIVNGFAGGSKTFSFLVGGVVPISIQIGGGMGLGTAAKAVVNAGSGGVTFDGEVIIAINPFMWLSVGVGIRNLLYAGVRGDANLNIRVSMDTSAKRPTSTGDFRASASVEVECLLFIKRKWELASYQKRLWPGGSRAMTAPAAFSIFGTDEPDLPDIDAPDLPDIDESDLLYMDKTKLLLEDEPAIFNMYGSGLASLDKPDPLDMVNPDHSSQNTPELPYPDEPDLSYIVEPDYSEQDDSELLVPDEPDPSDSEQSDLDEQDMFVLFESDEEVYCLIDNGYALSSRKYLNVTTPWNGDWNAGNSFSRSTVYSAGSSSPLQNGVLPGTTPTLARVGGQTIMIFQQDDGFSSTGNHIRLMYSILQDGVWRQPEPVWDTGTSDYFAKTLTVGNNLYLIWQKANACVNESEDAQNMLDQALTNMELCFAKWDINTLSFVGQDYITDNNVAEMNPILVSNGNDVTAIWTEVRNGHPLEIGGWDVVVSSTLRGGVWSAPETLFEAEGCVNELTAGYVGGDLLIVHSTFGDEDMPSIWLRRGDFNIPLSHAAGSSGLRFHDGKFFWQQAGAIYCFNDALNENNIQVVTVSGTLVSGPYKIVRNADKTAIVWTEPNPDRYVVDPVTNELVINPAVDQYVIKASIMGADGYGPPVTLKTVNDELASFDVALTDTGVWQIVMNTYRIAQDEDVDGDEGADDSEHALWYIEVEPRSDISLDYVYASAADVRNAMQPVGLVITNRGETTVRQVSVSMTGHDDLIRSVTLAPGQTITLNETVDLRKLPDDALLKAEVSFPGDSDPGNNTYEIELGLVDVAVSVMQEKVGNRLFLTVELSNSSDIETITKLTVYGNDKEGSVLSEAKRFIVGNRKNIEVFYQFNIDEMDENVNELYFEAETMKADFYLENNSVTMPIYRERLTPPDDPDWEQEITWIRVNGVSIRGESVLYRDGVNESRLKAQVYPENASNQNVTWASSDLRVAHVDSEGTLSLRAPGKTVITVITKDGAYMDRLEITVKDIVYSLIVEEAIGGYVNVNGSKADGTVGISGGDWVSLEAAPYVGYKFLRWVSSHTPVNNSTANPIAFAMPDENITIRPSFKLAGKNRVLRSITVKPPDRTEYYEGESLNLSGMIVLGNYDEGDGYGISGYTVTPAVGTPLTKDMTSVTVSYTEGGITRTASFEITVREPLLKSITVIAPDEVFYIEGEMLYLGGLVVIAHYTNGSREVFDYIADPGEGTILTLSHNTVTVSYTEGPITVTDSFEITVIKRIVITKVETGNKQVTVYFNIHSANGKGYVVYLSRGVDEQLSEYKEWNSNSQGIHINKLTNGNTYYIVIAYMKDGAITEMCEIIEVKI